MRLALTSLLLWGLKFLVDVLDISPWLEAKIAADLLSVMCY